ncbi:MAG: RNA polymerase sigma factor [Candidatus Kapaibacterium sp.]|nr:MAG: RNA polymerase sigma factor [Candidatus Kapabacteria bacterium]
MERLHLINDLAKGSESVLREIYDVYKNIVFNTALSYLRDRSEAEEITQDVFIEVFDSAKKFEGKSSVRTWVYRITVNKCLDRLRYLKRKKRFAQVQSLFKSGGTALQYDVADDDFEHPGIALDRQENAKILFKALQHLPQQQQTAFILSFMEELPRQEVADVMQISLKAVESLLQRAKANLRVALEKYYPDRRR